MIGAIVAVISVAWQIFSDLHSDLFPWEEESVMNDQMIVFTDNNISQLMPGRQMDTHTHTHTHTHTTTIVY